MILAEINLSVRVLTTNNKQHCQIKMYSLVKIQPRQNIIQTINTVCFIYKNKPMKKKYRLLKRENIYDDISSSNIALIFWLVYEFRLEPLFVDSQCYSHISI